MNREKILLEVLNEHGDFENVRQQFNENDLAVITESMLRFAKLGQTLPIDSVIVPKGTFFCRECNGKARLQNGAIWCENDECGVFYKAK